MLTKLTKLKTSLVESYWRFWSRFFLEAAKVFGKWNNKLHKWSVICIDKIRIP
tara:strand:+ start:269 stop:427 length:159 start_codon:yes stop_codon:yes gene_type:complete